MIGESGSFGLDETVAGSFRSSDVMERTLQPGAIEKAAWFASCSRKNSLARTTARMLRSLFERRVNTSQCRVSRSRSKPTEKTGGVSCHEYSSGLPLPPFGLVADSTTRQDSQSAAVSRHGAIACATVLPDMTYPRSNAIRGVTISFCEFGRSGVTISAVTRMDWEWLALMGPVCSVATGALMRAALSKFDLGFHWIQPFNSCQSTSC